MNHRRVFKGLKDSRVLFIYLFVCSVVSGDGVGEQREARSYLMDSMVVVCVSGGGEAMFPKRELFQVGVGRGGKQKGSGLQLAV